MVELSKLNGDKFYLNERWIEAIEALPDTTITLSSGNKFVVLEPMPVVLSKMVDWQKRMRQSLEAPKKKMARK